MEKHTNWDNYESVEIAGAQYLDLGKPSRSLVKSPIGSIKHKSGMNKRVLAMFVFLVLLSIMTAFYINGLVSSKMTGNVVALEQEKNQLAGQVKEAQEKIDVLNSSSTSNSNSKENLQIKAISDSLIDAQKKIAELESQLNQTKQQINNQTTIIKYRHIPVYISGSGY